MPGAAHISDPAFAFHYHPAACHETALARNAPLHVWNTYMREHFDRYIGHIFEWIAEQAYARLRGSPSLPSRSSDRECAHRAHPDLSGHLAEYALRGDDLASPNYAQYDVARGGRFIMLQPIGASTQLTVLVNWPKTLGAKQHGKSVAKYGIALSRQHAARRGCHRGDGIAVIPISALGP